MIVKTFNLQVKLVADVNVAGNNRKLLGQLIKHRRIEDICDLNDSKLYGRSYYC